uniref:Col_cuticle_N domain-containing protein n=1 Tax=Globodera pallida TaxID=36090 RepID=A0A183BSP2_GLOPA
MHPPHSKTCAMNYDTQVKAYKFVAYSALTFSLASVVAAFITIPFLRGFLIRHCSRGYEAHTAGSPSGGGASLGRAGGGHSAAGGGTCKPCCAPGPAGTPGRPGRHGKPGKPGAPGVPGAIGAGPGSFSLFFKYFKCQVLVCPKCTEYN